MLVEIHYNKIRTVQTDRRTTIIYNCRPKGAEKQVESEHTLVSQAECMHCHANTMWITRRKQEKKEKQVILYASRYGYYSPWTMRTN